MEKITIEINANTCYIDMCIDGIDKELFPKSYRVKNYQMYNQEAKGYAHKGVCTRAYLESDGVNKGINETGIKRMVSVVKFLRKRFDVVFDEDRNSLNHIEIPEEIRNA